jgi:hypothetical protein
MGSQPVVRLPVDGSVERGDLGDRVAGDERFEEVRPLDVGVGSGQQRIHRGPVGR